MIHTPSNIKKIKTQIYFYITWVEIDRKCNKLTDSMHGILKRLAFESLYVLTNKHMSTPEETICHFPVARVAWAVCSAESHRNWQRRHESLLPPRHARDIRRQDHRKWSLIGHLKLTWRCVCIFFVFCRKNLLRTRNIVMLIMPQWFRCQGRMSAHTGVG